MLLIGNYRIVSLVGTANDTNIHLITTRDTDNSNMCACNYIYAIIYRLKQFASVIAVTKLLVHFVKLIIAFVHLLP